ncbi:MAG TPA: hypothetical protein VEK76_10035 [Candidatus Binatia bacterium]|nr:hypothetical protein [Candidatus Binatia bacterium]
MKEWRAVWRNLETVPTVAFGWAYLGFTAVVLLGLFLPFVEQEYGCPPTQGCFLFVGVLRPTLFQGETGSALLGLVSGALLAGVFSLVRPRSPFLIAGAALSLAALGLVSFDAATAANWLWGPGDPLPVTLEAGFYLAAVGSAAASVSAIIALLTGIGRPRGSGGLSFRAAAS